MSSVTAKTDDCASLKTKPAPKENCRVTKEPEHEDHFRVTRSSVRKRLEMIREVSAKDVNCRPTRERSSTILPAEKVPEVALDVSNDESMDDSEFEATDVGSENDSDYRTADDDCETSDDDSSVISIYESSDFKSVGDSGTEVEVSDLDSHADVECNDKSAVKAVDGLMYDSKFTVSAANVVEAETAVIAESIIARTGIDSQSSESDVASVDDADLKATDAAVCDVTADFDTEITMIPLCPSVPSVPYPESFEGDGAGDLQPTGVASNNIPVECAPFWKMVDFLIMIKESNIEGTGFQMEGGEYYLSADIAMALLRSGELKRLPRNIQAILATKRTKLTAEQCLQVAQYHGFVCFPENTTRGIHGDMNKSKHVVIDKRGKGNLAVVYYGCKHGFFIAFHRDWLKPKTAKRYRE
ncbi:hypothetical protein FisN_12Lu391 [Fistulifera solaris]|uniref:Uncharacterized protein n=1 Tax=Fistulifera solaris TaxID=1519565 RepID=A0A1Z5JLZ6_FISSO|nr:hypothetical protein FisN_12Lu391 [Fistulifera solaris]|eukprot:GAX15043.1 hypothetical protein FisN_12Lu391 [Fistulifera solaris]